MDGDVGYGLSFESMVVNNFEKELFIAAEMVFKVCKESSNKFGEELHKFRQSSFLKFEHVFQTSLEPQK